ncbi:NAD(P)-dependent oxidoreductase [Clostridium botulinum]|nr:NAD(P)-dependent oxidoreductase [Clostridium botulinum]
MKDKVIISGINGFVGKNLFDFYVRKGYQVWGISRNCNQNDKRIIESDLQLDDLTNEYEKIKPNVFIHCVGSADVGLSIREPIHDFNANVMTLYNTLLSLKKASPNCRFIFLSSAAVYGNPKKLPISEEDILKPISPYGLHKKICEDICMYFIKNHEMDIRILRIFSAYGNGLKKQLLWDIHRKANDSDEIKLFGNGNESRDYIHISDLINAIHLVSTTNEKEITFNISNGKEEYIKDIAKMVEKYYENEKKVTFNNITKKGDPLNWRADINRLKSLGYVQEKNIEAGILDYLKWSDTIVE